LIWFDLFWFDLIWFDLSFLSLVTETTEDWQIATIKKFSNLFSTSLSCSNYLSDTRYLFTWNFQKLFCTNLFFLFGNTGGRFQYIFRVFFSHLLIRIAIFNWNYSFLLHHFCKIIKSPSKLFYQILKACGKYFLNSIIKIWLLVQETVQYL